MKLYSKFLIALSLVLVVAVSCTKPKSDPVPAILPVDIVKELPKEYGKLKITIEHLSGDQEFALNKEYVNANKDTFSVSVLQYFISNIKLSNWNEDTIFSLPKSYHLIKAGNGDVVLEFDSIPVKNYNKFIYSIGVDSIANHSVDHASGDLQPSGADGMIWSWNTGYKFMKFEGSYKTDTTKTGKFVFHVGKDANYKKIVEGGHHATRQLKTTHFGLFISKNETSNLHFEVNVLALMGTGSIHVVNLDQMNAIHGDNASIISDNYAMGFIAVHKE